MNLHEFLADLQRGTAEQFKRELELSNLRAMTESVAKPVPSVQEQQHTVEQMRGES